MAAKDFDALADALETGVGKNDKPSQVSHYVDMGFLPLNAASSGDYDGGAPSGRIIEIIGAPSSGKTALATILMINAQKMGGIAAFHDHERSFSEEMAEKNGLDLSRGKWLYKKPKTYEESIETYAKVVTIIRQSKVIPKDAPIVYVFDSVAAMIPQGQYGKDFSALNMNDMTMLARVTSQTMKQIALIAEEHNVLTIFLNQIREKPGVMFGDPTTSPGGNALKFFASQRINLGASKIQIGSGETKEVIGSEITAVFVKNKVSRPFLKAKWRITYGEDGCAYFDEIGSTVDFMLSKGMLESGTKGRVTWKGKSLYKKDAIEQIKADGGIEALNAIIRKHGVVLEEDEKQKEIMEKEAEREAALGSLESI